MEPQTIKPPEDSQDMTVSNTGVMEENAQQPAQNNVMSPNSVMDVSPPPEDPAVGIPPASGAAQTTAENVVRPAGTDPLPAPVAAKPKSSKPLVVAIAIVLALIMVSVAVLAYMKSNTSKTAKSTGQNTVAKTAAKTPVTKAEVASANKDIDTTLSSLNDSKDFSADTLSDKSLGLQ